MLFRGNRRTPIGSIVLAAADFFAIVLSIGCAAILRLGPYDVSWSAYLRERFLVFALASILFLVIFYAVGLYERQALARRENTWVMPAAASLIGLVVTILLFFAHPDFSVGRGVLFLAGVFIFFATWTLRSVYRIAVGLGFLSRNALIVGGGDAAHRMLKLLRDTTDAGFQVFGLVTHDKNQEGTYVQGVRVLGSQSQLSEFVDRYEIETILVAASSSEELSLLKSLRPLRYAGVDVIDYVGLCEELAQQIPLDDIDDEWLMHAAMNSSAIHIRKIKRVMDVVVSLVGLLLSAPVLILAVLAIKWDSPGPVLYRQRRSGLEGKPYTVFKFRTMKKDAEAESGAMWAKKEDTRITRTGAFMRTWRLDEVPQLVNVLKGEMSLVGPRPERPEFVEELSDSIPFYKERLMVPPGVTGWAQVKYPYAASIEAARRKLQYDLYYIKHMRFLLDCQILLRTFRTIIVGTRHSGDEDEEEISLH